MADSGTHYPSIPPTSRIPVLTLGPDLSFEEKQRIAGLRSLELGGFPMGFEHEGEIYETVFRCKKLTNNFGEPSY
jgi:hypothetical protein